MDEPEHRQRAVPPAVLQARAARAVARPFSNRLGEWQSESIKLQAMATREPDSAGKIAAATRNLLATVNEAEAEFGKKVDGLTETERRHGSISDTRRGFEMIRSRLQQMLAGLS